MDKKEVFKKLIALDYNEETGKWYKDNIVVQKKGTEYKVSVKEGDEFINCDVPSVTALINFLTRLFGVPPTFKTSKHIKPTKTGLVTVEGEGSMKGRKIQDK